MALTCEITFVKYTLFALNFIGWLAGIAIFVIGIWIATDSDLQKYVEQMSFEHYYIGAYLIIAAGVVMIIIGFLGCCGAINENVCMLTTYFIFLFIIFLLELAAAIYMLSVGFEYTKMDKFVYNGMYKMVCNYNNDAVGWVMDILQLDLKCCGVNNGQDYDSISLPVPNSCRDPITGNQFHIGCYDSFIDFIEARSGTIVGISITICIIHIVTMIFAMCLCLALKRENKTYA